MANTLRTVVFPSPFGPPPGVTQRLHLSAEATSFADEQPGSAAVLHGALITIAITAEDGAAVNTLAQESFDIKLVSRGQNSIGLETPGLRLVDWDNDVSLDRPFYVMTVTSDRGLGVVQRGSLLALTVRETHRYLRGLNVDGTPDFGIAIDAIGYHVVVVA